MNVKKPLSPLALLSAAALSLPAFSASQPTERVVSVNTSVYQEGDANAAEVVFGDLQRFRVKTNQFNLSAPIGRDWSMSLGYDNEAMSGASPWGTVAASDGSGDLIMSGASIDDSRNGVDVTLTRHWRGQSLGVSVGYSGEHDYHSRSMGVNYERDFFKQNTTLALSVSYASDELTPTDAQLFQRLEKGAKQTRSFYASVNQLLSPVSMLNLGFGITKRTGELSDPYKLRDIRPDNRVERTLTANYRRYVDWQTSSLAVNYRYFWDSYSVGAHTLAMSWMLGDEAGVQWGPMLRYYSQSEAAFYTPWDRYDQPDTMAQSSDFRLSTFGAVSYGLKARYRIRRVQVSMQYERYDSGSGYALSSTKTEHPGLVDFEVLSLGAAYRF